MFDYEADVFNFRYYPHKTPNRYSKGTEVEVFPPSHRRFLCHMKKWRYEEDLCVATAKAYYAILLVHHVEDQLAGLENGPFESPVVRCLEQSKR